MTVEHHREVPYGAEFVTNGYLVVAPSRIAHAEEYQGIDDDRWPIESERGSYEPLLRALGVPEPLEGAEVATRWNEALAYWQRCVAVRPYTRLMLLSTRYEAPRVLPPGVPWTRLGYDVADPMGNHSVLWHELIAGTAPQLAHWRPRLNAVGLFDELEVAEDFIRERRSTAERGDRRGMELGAGFHFVPVLVHLYTGA